MPEQFYNPLAILLSYAFMLLGAGVAVLGMLTLRADNRARRDLLRGLPDAGNVGEFLVLRGAGKLTQGMCVPVPPEGMLGSARNCDVRLPHPDVPARAALLALSKQGVVVTPWANGKTAVPLRVNGHDYDKPVILTHGCRLEWGSLSLRIRLFEGTEELAERHAPPVETNAVAAQDAAAKPNKTPRPPKAPKAAIKATKETGASKPPNQPAAAPQTAALSEPSRAPAKPRAAAPKLVLHDIHGEGQAIPKARKAPAAPQRDGIDIPLVSGGKGRKA